MSPAEGQPASQPAAARTHAQRLASRDGYFEPESVIRRLGNTPVTPFLGGGAAVLLQVAHPLVAAGVADHSEFDRDLWHRLGRTLRALYVMTYGTKAEAEEAGAVVQAVHTHVRGSTREPLGRFPAGTPYSATTPELMLWVHATLVYASLSAYQRFVAKLTPDERECYYQQMSLVARLFGTPASVIPPTLGEFREYFHAQVDGDDLCVTRPAREIARVIFDPPLPAPMRLLVPAHRLATAALLPEKLRGAYGLRWTPFRELALPVAARSLHVGAIPVLRVASKIALRPRAVPSTRARHSSARSACGVSGDVISRV
jgi:uncharacterized protein (DUF2236 family)